MQEQHAIELAPGLEIPALGLGVFSRSVPRRAG